MGDKIDRGHRAGRRDLLKAAAGAASASLLGSLIGSAQAQTPPATPATGSTRTGLNILFIFTDQARYHARSPRPCLAARTAVTPANRQCPTPMCASSRAVMLTGLTRPDLGMYENLDVPWMQNLPLDKPTVGHMLRKAGYYTAYKGKWHLSR